MGGLVLETVERELDLHLVSILSQPFYLYEHEIFFFFSSRRRHTRFDCDWSSDVCSSDLECQRSRPHAWNLNSRPVRLLGSTREGGCAGIRVRAASRACRARGPDSSAAKPDRKSVV